MNSSSKTDPAFQQQQTEVEGEEAGVTTLGLKVGAYGALQKGVLSLAVEVSRGKGVLEALAWLSVYLLGSLYRAWNS
jgi:hypothetical protein